MKNFGKILTVVLICMCLVATFVVAALAADDEYTGKMDKLNELITELEQAEKTTEKVAKLKEIKSYYPTVDPASDGYSDASKKIATLVLPVVDVYVAEANIEGVDPAKAPTASKRYASLISAASVLYTVPTDTSIEGAEATYKAFDAMAAEVAKALFDCIDDNIAETRKAAQNTAYINRTEYFINTCTPVLMTFDEAYGDVAAALPELKAATNAVAEEIKAENEDKNLISDYDLTVFRTDDFEALKLQSNDKSANIGPFSTVPKNNEGDSDTRPGYDNYHGIRDEESGNKYLFADHNDGKKDSFFQYSFASYPDTQGYVVEFDFTTFDELPSGVISIQPGGTQTTSGKEGKVFPTNYLEINSAGDLTIPTNKQTGEAAKTVIEGLVTPGVWTHFALVLDPFDFVIRIYINGELVNTADARYPNHTYNFQASAFRFSATSYTGSFAVDNFAHYAGTAPRDFNRITDLTTDEAMLYYSDYLMDESRDLNGRFLSYERITELLPNYWVWNNDEQTEGDYIGLAATDAEYKKAVDDYLSFGLDEFVENVQLSNLEEYKRMIEELLTIERTADTLATRQSAVQKIDDFSYTYSSLINKTLDSDGDGTVDYVEYNGMLSDASLKAQQDNNSFDFVRQMNRFQEAKTLAALERYYAKANEYVESNLVDVEMGSDPDHPDRVHFPEFVAAFETYLASGEILAERQREGNSEKIITCISFIKEYDTPEEWEANFDFISKYLDIVTEPILERDANGGLLYDATVDGMIDAIDYFETTYAYFYNKYQEAHIVYMNDILDKMISTEAYVEKMGMASLLRRYLANNDINLENSQVVNIINNLETVEAELTLREEDYSKLLKQNSVYLVNLVEKMRTAETYAEQKKYYDEASLLYFNVDILVEGTEEAMAIFDRFTVTLAARAEMSSKFNEYMAIYNAASSEDERYAALVACCIYKDDADITYPGMADSMAQYEAAYSNYMNYANAVNGDVSAIGNAVGSLRSNCGITPVIAIIIKAIFGE